MSSLGTMMDFPPSWFMYRPSKCIFYHKCFPIISKLGTDDLQAMLDKTGSKAISQQPYDKS
jgi:hypothetical protein